jgi:predicted enzyme related to lactoylglutathione lyase
MGPDRDALVRFYGEAFGWLFEPHDEMNYTMFRTAPGWIGGGIGVPQDGKPSVSVYAEVESLDATLTKALELGATGKMGPMDIGGGARIAMFADPASNVFGLYEGPTGTPPEGAGSPVVWFDVFGPDAVALQSFYRDLFEWKIDLGKDGYGHVAAEADGVGGGIWTPLTGMPSHGILVYVRSTDLEGSLKIIERIGGTTVTARESVGDGLEISLFRDVAGNLNGLVQYG